MAKLRKKLRIKALKYDVCGPFDFVLPQGRVLNSKDKAAFWDAVSETQDGISEACGCYVFAIRHGSNYTPWYVGKAERTSFSKECFTHHKIEIYRAAQSKKRGTLTMFLLPKITDKRAAFTKPTSGKHRDIDFLEALLIARSLEENSELMNIKKTKFLRDMYVPGIVNNTQTRPKNSVAALRNALGS